MTKNPGQLFVAQDIKKVKNYSAAELRKYMKKEELNIYVSPKVKTVEIEAQAIICQSVCSINSMEIDSDGGNDFE